MKNVVKSAISSVLSLIVVAMAITVGGHAADVEVRIKEWKVPPQGHNPHAPLVAGNGMIWYTGNDSSTIVRFDPNTEQFKVYPTKTPNSKPHNAIEDKDGNIWYTSATPSPTPPGGRDPNMRAHIGKFNPKTEEFTEYFINDPTVIRPHTPIFDLKGNLWFTCSGSNHIGKFDPKTEEFTMLPSPLGGDGSTFAPAYLRNANIIPYGIEHDSKGTIWFTTYRGNSIYSIDPDTMVFTRYLLPHQELETSAHRIAIAPDDRIYYGLWSRGYLGRYDPKIDKFDEWPSPGGAWSAPHGITAVGDIIWYNESGMRPNTIVRFDTKTEKFQSWKASKGCGAMSYLVHDSKGIIWYSCGAGDTLGRVEVAGEAPTTPAVSSSTPPRRD